MPQQDLYHHQVRNALIKDGWTIVDDPFQIAYKGMRVYADLGAEKVIAASKANRKIVVEIKALTRHHQLLSWKERLANTPFITHF